SEHHVLVPPVFACVAPPSGAPATSNRHASAAARASFPPLPSGRARFNTIGRSNGDPERVALHLHPAVLAPSKSSGWPAPARHVTKPLKAEDRLESECRRARRLRGISCFTEPR